VGQGLRRAEQYVGIAEAQLTSAFYASMAKAFASKTAVENANLGVQVYGGLGYNTEAPMEKLFRDSKIYELCKCTGWVLFR
jgi:acyl-CoA dehydrogenase